MLGMVHLVAVHTKHLPFVREIRPGYCKTALLGLLVKSGLPMLQTTSLILIYFYFSALNFSSTHETFEIQTERKYCSTDEVQSVIP